MHLVFDIFQGIGIAAAVGIRPFLPALVVGALAAGNVQINFDGTDFSFLENAPFLAGMAVGAIAVALADRELHKHAAMRRPVVWVLVGVGLAIGALLFAGALAQNHYAAWTGAIGGVVCAAVGAAAIGPLLARVRARLDPEVASAVPLYAEGAAVALAALSVLAPPVGPIGLGLLVWLLLASRRRAGQKYAGLRILR
jgi:hypothetical protein